MQSLNQFIASNNGKRLEVNDPTNLFQCMDLAYAWTDNLNIPRSTIAHLYAYQVFTQPNADTRKYFDIISNNPLNSPKPGDLVVWSTKVGFAGHIAICNTAGILNLQTFDQNWFGATYCRLVDHGWSYSGVLGWLRPKPTTAPLDPFKQTIHDIIYGGESADTKVSKIKDLIPQ